MVVLFQQYTENICFFSNVSTGGLRDWGILLVISLEFQGNKASTVFYDTAFKKRAEKTKHVRKPFHTFLRCFSPPAHPTNNPAPHPILHTDTLRPPTGLPHACGGVIIPGVFGTEDIKSSLRTWGCHPPYGHAPAMPPHPPPSRLQKSWEMVGVGFGEGDEEAFLQKGSSSPSPIFTSPTPPQPQTWPTPIRAWRNGRS